MTSAPVRPRAGLEDGVVRDLAEARREAAIAAQQLEQRRRAARGAVERDLLELGPRHVAHEQHRAHGAEARDGDARDGAQRGGRLGVGGHGDEAHVDLARGEELRAARGQLERQLEAILAEAALEPVGDGARVQERDGRDR